MGIIFADIKKWEETKNANNIPIVGDTDYDKAKTAFEFIKKANKMVFDGIIVTEYEDILREIKKQYSYEKRSTEQYWNDKTNRDYMVYMIYENILLSYDYFLYREKSVSEFYKCEEHPEACFNYIFKEKLDADKIIKKKMIEDVINLEILEGIFRGDVHKELCYNEIVNDPDYSVKKILFTAKSGVAKKLDENFLIQENKVGQTSLFDYYRFIFLVYYLDKHGIIFEDGTIRKFKILDAVSKPNIQLLPNFLEHEDIVEPALEIEILKNEIVKHLPLAKICRINRIYIQLFELYNVTFFYIANLLNYPIDFVLEKKELEDIERRVNNCISVVNKIHKYEKTRRYDDSVWEIAYHRYKGFITKCERNDSYRSLEFAIELSDPTGTKLFEAVNEKNKYKYVSRYDLTSFMEQNTEWISEVLSEKCTKRWVKNHIPDAIKLLNIMEYFYRKQIDDHFPLTMVFAVFQALYEVKTKNLKYENNYKGYSGNKKVSLYATLGNMQINGSNDTYDYAWTAIIKRWCNYNEGKYELWKQFTKIDLIFTQLIEMVINLESIDNIDILIEGLFVELLLPEKYRMTGIKEIVNDSFVKLTGYSIEIEDTRILRELEREEVRKYFVNTLADIIMWNENNYTDNRFIFHFNMKYMAIKLEQDVLENKIKLIDFRYLRLGNEYNMFRKAIQMDLPWFTENFTDF